MIVKNEEKVIERCLNSVLGHVDEIIIVDTGSNDKTKEISLNFPVQLYDFKWENDFSKARNFSISKASNDWILVMDADEVLVGFDKDSVHSFLLNQNQIGRVKMVSEFLVNGHKQQARNYISRIFPKGVSFDGQIHEQLSSDLIRNNIPIEIYHDGYLDHDKSKRNVPILLNALEKKPTDDYLLFQLAREYKGLKNNKLSMENYEKCFDILDKNSSYYPLAVVDYLYLCIEEKAFNKGLDMMEREKNRLERFSDFHFVCALFYMELILNSPSLHLNKLPLIENLYKRCIELGDSEIFDGVIGTGTFLAFYNLGTFYESFGQNDKAKKYYILAAQYNYNKALERLKFL